jgi:hypothetical protein
MAANLQTQIHSSMTFKVNNRVYSVTQVIGSKIHASATKRGRRLRGRPRHFNAAEVGNLTVRPIALRK